MLNNNYLVIEKDHSYMNATEFGYECTPKTSETNKCCVCSDKIETKLVNPLVTGLENASNITTTENMAKAYKSTLDNLLDFFGNAGSMRKRTEADIVQLFSKAFAQDRLLALKALFYIRDSRGGQGERRVFRVILKWLANNYPEIVRKNLTNVPFFGRYDDVYVLFDTDLERDVIKAMAIQLAKDWYNMKAGKPVSLLAKWLKSENTSSRESVFLAIKFRKALDWSSKKYRKTLSTLRKYIDVVEVKMCANQFNEINFGKLPSKAHLNYRKSFEKRAGENYKEYLAKVEKGEDKINASALYPYDILRAIVESTTITTIKAADLQWKALPDYVKEGGSGICICDVSGSMDGLPLYVSISLGIYFAERNIGPFKDVFMTFSNTPCFHRIIGNNLREKWNNFDRTGWGMNTDLVSSFRLILNTAVKNGVEPKDMPSKIFVITDMEFDYCSSGRNTNFQEIDEMYKRAGYDRPGLIFWNVDSRNNHNPVVFNDNNVCLVSGCSPSILKSIMGKKILSPMEVMLDTITNKRYDSVVV